MNDICPEHAALIVQAACGLNMTNAALRGLATYKPRDKKMAPQLTELRRLSEVALPRMVAACGSREVDFINLLTNSIEAIVRACVRLDGPGIAAVLAQAEAAAREADAQPACLIY